jgi:predicted amidophosphoribosyltransferase
MDSKEPKGGVFDGPICRACQKRLSDKEGAFCLSCAAKMRNADEFASRRRFIRYDMIHGGVLIPTSIDNRRN